MDGAVDCASAGRCRAVARDTRPAKSQQSVGTVSR